MSDAAQTQGSRLEALSAQLGRMEVEHQVFNDAVVVELPGTRKLKTTVLLVPGPDSLRVEAFVARAPEENHAGVHEWLLHRNRRMFGIAYTIDLRGDIYLVGQLPAVLGDGDLDRLLGQILEASDGDFNSILEMGFSTSIRKEWKWRTERGESVANLRQFEHLAQDRTKDDAAAESADADSADPEPTAEPTDGGEAENTRR